MSDTTKTNVTEKIKDYLLSGGIWNPELAIHDNVRDLIIDCQTEIESLQRECDEWRITALSLKAGESELLKENAKLHDIAERAVSKAEYAARLLPQHGMPVCAAKLRAELDQLKTTK